MESVRLLKTLLVAAAGVAAALVAGGCAPKLQPRSFAEYLEDRPLMEGTLARCDADREGTHDDLDCANARRAAVTIALRVEEARREELERESERKLTELRDELARREQREREALAEAEAARQAAYEAIWKGNAVPPNAAELIGGQNATAGNAATDRPAPAAPQ
ncbi:MAG TPA: EexN family lipoprotein [Gammaproteobacteria bacterium]|jgi:hypothetical protein